VHPAPAALAGRIWERPWRPFRKLERHVFFVLTRCFYSTSCHSRSLRQQLWHREKCRKSPISFFIITRCFY
jgi:hypothetical protein